MTGWCIVAIPSENDYVWKLSSEKIPHMTMLFLGEQDGNPHGLEMAEFVEHVATTLPRFSLRVDHRGTLGPENADVLFFKESDGDRYYDISDVKTARSNLLQDPNIFAAYNSTTQYPQWTPHLTLGYPTAPAHEDERDYPGTYSVNFDRLALWTGDFVGPEFLLQEQELSMSDPVANVLAHHGVKGMKWGQHKKLSRKEVRAEKHAFYEAKANRLIQQALKDPTTLIALNTGGVHPTVVTGREFVQHLSYGGVMNIKMTDVYATKKKGQYVMNQNPNEKFVRSDKK